MKTVKEIKTHLEDLSFGYFKDEDTFVELDNEEALQALAKTKDFPERIIEAIDVFRTSLIELLTEDLTDIWERLDRLEENSL